MAPRRPFGLLTFSGPEGVQEMHTFTCNHCGGLVRFAAFANPEDLGGRCSLCADLICPACVSKGQCDPFEEKLKRAEAKGEALRSYGLG